MESIRNILKKNIGYKKGFLFLFTFVLILSIFLSLIDLKKKMVVQTLQAKKDQIILEGLEELQLAVREKERRKEEEARKTEEKRLEEERQKATLNAAMAEKKRQEELIRKQTQVLGSQINTQTVTFGYSGQGRAITGSVFGNGSETILLFGAIHGNEKGTAALLNTFIQEIAKNSSLVGANKKIVIIPLLNLDGYYLGLNKVNANNVNLNLNFETTDWKQYGGDSNLFAGNEPFTESESRILREVVAKYDVKKMISFHAQGNLVNPEYGHGPSEEFARWYAGLSGYNYFNDISWYYHGTATRWFVEKYGRPAITVELSCYTCSDWWKNRQALLELIK